MEWPHVKTLGGIKKERLRAGEGCAMMRSKERLQLIPEIRGIKLVFTGGHISFTVAFKGPNVILGLYKCNYFLTVK